MKSLLVLVALAGSAAPFAFQEPAPSTAPKEAAAVKASDVKWVDHVAIQGAKMCVLSGDPSKGPSVILMKFPKGMAIAPHWHTSGEVITLVSGKGVFGMGETADVAKGTELGSGAFILMPGKVPHWAQATEEFVISVTLDKAADFHLCGEAK